MEWRSEFNWTIQEEIEFVSRYIDTLLNSDGVYFSNHLTIFLDHRDEVELYQKQFGLDEEQRRIIQEVDRKILKNISRFIGAWDFKPSEGNNRLHDESHWWWYLDKIKEGEMPLVKEAYVK